MGGAGCFGVELRRMAARESLLDVADRLLRTVALVAVDDAVLTAAETMGPSTIAQDRAAGTVLNAAVAQAGDGLRAANSSATSAPSSGCAK